MELYALSQDFITNSMKTRMIVFFFNLKVRFEWVKIFMYAYKRYVFCFIIEVCTVTSSC